MLQRQGDANHPGLAGILGQDLQFTMVGFDDFAAHRKSQPQADVPRREERGRSLLNRFGGETMPVVLDIDLQPVRTAAVGIRV